MGTKQDSLVGTIGIQQRHPKEMLPVQLNSETEDHLLTLGGEEFFLCSDGETLEAGFARDRVYSRAHSDNKKVLSYQKAIVQENYIPKFRESDL